MIGKNSLFKTKEEEERVKAEVKKIWEKYKDVESLKDIFLKRLNDYFPNPKILSKEWTTFIRWTSTWTKNERLIKRRKMVEEMSDEDIEKIQNANRKMTILLLRDILDKYHKNPKSLKNLTPKDITLIYKMIQQAEDAIAKTKIAKSKLGLEAAKTFLFQYNRLSEDELKNLKNKIEESFTRLIESKNESNIK